MATFKIYKLHFPSPLHIGSKRDDEGLSLKTIQSDTLVAAITSLLARVGETVPVDGDWGFTVSSLFPFYQEEKEKPATYFLPMPLQSRLPKLTDVSKAKSVKKVKWVDAQLYPTLLSGENLFDDSSQHFGDIHGDYLTSNDLPSDFIRSEVCQRVMIEDRTGQSDAKPYYVDRITFADSAGLYFLATGDPRLLDKGMALLAHEGIGTDRNVGYGGFELTTDELSIATPADADHVVSLSLLIPKDKVQLSQMLASDDVAYELTRRGGWITSMPHMQLRKNAIYGFMPGSVFSCPQGEVIGAIFNLAPGIVRQSSDSHPVWRDGRAITLPIIR